MNFVCSAPALKHIIPFSMLLNQKIDSIMIPIIL